MTCPAPLPPDEAHRLARLKALAVLDTAPEPVFDALTRLASQVCGVPIALVSLIDAERQWFKSATGLEGVSETPRDVAFCAHAILGSDVLEVNDARQDPRFERNPLVCDDPHIRFYAGAPIALDDGTRIGTLCVIDREPRELNAHQRAMLRELADAAAAALAMRGQAIEQTLQAKSRYEDELREREHRYRMLVEDQSELISLMDPDGTLRFVNGAYARFLGVEAEALVGRSIYDLIAPEDCSGVRQHLAALCEQGEVWDGENRMQGHDGRLHWFGWTNRVRRDAEGRVLCIHSVGRDVTAYRAAAEALRQSEARLRTLYERTPAMLCSMDAANRILTVSDTWLDKMGYARDEVVGRPVDALMAPGMAPTRAHARAELERHGRCLDMPYRLLRKDGSVLETLMSAILERDDHDQHVRTVTILEDVTRRRAVEAELKAHQERLRVATQANGIGIWEFDIAADRLMWSDEMFGIFGCPRETFSGKLDDWRRCIHPDDRAHSAQVFAEALAGRRTLDYDFRVQHPDGTMRSVYARATIFRDDHGQAVRVVGTNYDITERKRMERELAEKHELLRVTLLSIGDAVITTDAQGRVQWLNPVAERMTAWSTEAARGLPLAEVFQIVDEHSRLPAPCPVTRCLSDHHAIPLCRHTQLLSRNGSEYGIEESAAPIRDDQGTVLGVVLVFHDVTEQRRMGREMRFRATHDELTGLINRGEFERRLTHTLEKAHADRTHHAMMYIDLDQFKLVNDACGHAMGDQLLCQVTTLLQGCVRSRDTLARLGGDEFGVILEHCTVEQAQRVAQQICDAMEDFRFTHEGRRFRIGTSIGLVPVDARWANASLVLQAADTACYAAKEAGRNRVHAWYDTDQMLKARQGEMQWASRLEQAIDEDRFVLYAQRIAPLGQHAAHEGLHAELLIRLRDDDGKLIPPGAFLPAAERFHMASRIDRWVLRHAFRVLEAHEGDLGHVATLTVNLSGQSIGDKAFHRFVAELVSRTRIDVRKLCLEITETAAITNLADATVFIDEMRRLGVRIALDDFGAGSSSFGYLKSLAVDYLKIDGQFIKTLTSNALDHAAVRCFRDVAQVLGIRTIAEFVEDEATVTELRRIGVDYAQGYLVHRPEPLETALGLHAPQTA
ncbi:bifunctional diguanylate cyclase/phosphodiesterase [Aquabacterium olei]|uniref:Bifunctional diguanylate cyclase/phosphodiesterase n=1 Tax=Aquabacterium olei TaxID=1296669 RepID=A0A2U8FVA6_9BURK|nr:PAS domain S-box protein [Aquabacterium olei]AWI54950.1 bifunctional diguanylate cyclase/phosphodiesterase [Aquabacterium olei]